MKTKTPTVTVELTEEQFALFSSLARPHRVSPGELMLALAAIQLETHPDPEHDGSVIVEALHRICNERATPEVAPAWEDCGLITASAHRLEVSHA